MYNVLMFTPNLVTAIKAVIFPITLETSDCISAPTIAITASDHSSSTEIDKIYLMKDNGNNNGNVFKKVSINRCEAYNISVCHFYGHMDPPNHCNGNRNKTAIEARDCYRGRFHLDYLCWCVDCPCLSWYLCVVDGKRLAKGSELCSWVVAQCQCHWMPLFNLS